MSPPGRHRPEADGLRQATDGPQGLSVSGLNPNGEHRSAQHEGTPVSLVGDALRSTRGRIVIGAMIALAVWKIGLVLIAPTKVTSGFVPNAQGRVNVLVTLRFAPERFHVLVFQQHGRVSGTQDTSIEVRGVRQTDLNAMARPYWVLRVQPLPADG
jgi:hypothetical protein